MSTGTDNGVYVEINGIRMRASTETLRYFPVAVRLCKPTEGFYYYDDDGSDELKMEWFADDVEGNVSTYRFVFEDGTIPEAVPETPELEAEVKEWFHRCLHQTKFDPVMYLYEDGQISLGDSDF